MDKKEFFEDDIDYIDLVIQSSEIEEQLYDNSYIIKGISKKTY